MHYWEGRDHEEYGREKKTDERQAKRDSLEKATDSNIK